MKPIIGQWIYKIYHESISKMKVYMRGTNEFCTEEAFDDLYLLDSRQPLAYNEYGETWFFTLAEAKEKLKEEYPDYKIVKLNESYWEAVSKEDE